MDNTILKFLLGEGDIDGVWYGDKHPAYTGNFWWRNHLRQYLESAQLQQPVVMQGLPYYQLCPKCFGEGIVDNPYARGTSSVPTRPCPVCNGAKTFYHALSGSPTVGKAGEDASVSDGK